MRHLLRSKIAKPINLYSLISEHRRPISRSANSDSEEYCWPKSQHARADRRNWGFDMERSHVFERSDDVAHRVSRPAVTRIDTNGMIVHDDLR